MRPFLVNTVATPSSVDKAYLSSIGFADAASELVTLFVIIFFFAQLARGNPLSLKL